MPASVRVDNRVRVLIEGLPDGALAELESAFTHENPGHKRDGEGPPFERTFVEDGGWMTLPRGGMSRVREVLSEVGVSVSDDRCEGDYSLLDDDWEGRIPEHRVELWDFQERIVDAVLRKQNCIVEAVTGGGKSTAALAAISRAQVPALVIVNTGGLRDQWVRRAAKELGVGEDDIGIIGDGQWRTAPLTIAMQQTLARAGKRLQREAFGFVVCDEVDLFAAPTFFAAVDPWPAKYRVGVTATVKRHDKRDYLVRDLFGDVVAEVTREEALAKGRIVDVEIRVVFTDFDAPWYRAVIMGGNKWQLFAAHKKLVWQMWNDRRRNRTVLQIVAAETARRHQVIVLSSRREHCLMLDRMFVEQGMKSGVMLGGPDGKREFERTRVELMAGRKQVIVGTDKAIGRGQDFPAIGVGVATMPISNNKTQVKQIVGRLCRACESAGKKGGVLYVLVDRAVHGQKKPLENLIKWNGGNVKVRMPDGTYRDAKQVLGGMRGMSHVGRPSAEDMLDDD